MNQIHINVIVFGYIPKAIFVVSLGLVLIGKCPPIKSLILVSIIQGSSVYFIRDNADFGVHTLFQYISLCILVWLTMKISLKSTLLGISIGYVISNLIEGVMVIIIPKLIGVPLMEIMSRSWGKVGLLFPQILTLALLVYLCIRYNFTIEKEIETLKIGNRKN